MISAVKKLILPILDTIGRYVLLIVEVIRVCIRRPPQFSLISEQLYAVGVQSAPVVAITGFSTGLVLTAQSFFQLADKGLASATGLMVAKAMATELGPVLTAFMVTGRVGASMCAELGTMRVTEQIDAMHSMAINPLRYLIGPRFIAGILMLPLLTIFSCAMGMLGAYLLSVGHFGMTSTAFLNPIPLHVTGFEIYSGVLKSFFFGMIIVTISCFKGMTTSGGAAGVGRATTNSVVICYAIVLISNFILTLTLNIFEPY
jgi:phospholipid/cholesterol/gamma-HCH transport system permease protein